MALLMFLTTQAVQAVSPWQHSHVVDICPREICSDVPWDSREGSAVNESLMFERLAVFMYTVWLVSVQHLS